MSFNSAQELAAALAEHYRGAEKIATIDVRRLNRVLELTPEDMTVTVESGISLGALQRELAKHRQWLPIDPPNAERVSIHDLLARDLSGPRRFGYGTIREHLIGMTVALADGRLIKSGGKVVKNVAGYDLAKLFIGAQDSLGVIVEAAFKLRPMPEVERIVSLRVALPEAGKVLRSVLESELTPVILDLHSLDATAESLALRSDPAPARNRNTAVAPWIVAGFAGTREEVEWQFGIARALGFTNEGTLDYEPQFWDAAGTVNRVSVLPSRVVETVADYGPAPFVARAGNGVIYFRGEAMAQKHNLPVELMRRVKGAFDAKSMLPTMPS